MNQYELETFELILEVYDYNPLMPNELIGFYSIGLSTMHRNLNHEFYKTWLTLFNPKHPRDIAGYLLVSCFIVGPNERPPSHGMDEAMEDDDDANEEEMADMNEEQKQEVMARRAGLFIVSEPNMIKKGYQLSVNIVKAEGLPNIDRGGINSFVSVRIVGSV